MPLSKNIKIVYLITALQNSWFWIAIWVLYYLRFTDYTGIGMLETIMVSAAVFGEIPTGAIADLLGKKYTLTLAFFFGALGNIVMGFATGFGLLAAGVILATLGHILTSGTMEALVYDTLKTNAAESKYQKILANISSVRMLALALSSATGGFMYLVSPSLPFFVVGVAQLFALLLTFWLTEPEIDTDVFNWANYKRQTLLGFKELCKSRKATARNSAIIAMTVLTAVNVEMLIDFQLVAQGWSEVQLGFLMTCMFIASAGFGQLSVHFTKFFGAFAATSLAAVLIAGTMAIIPFIGIIFGTLVIVFRNGLIVIFENSASESINSTTQSKYRATTLSTYSMLSRMPYIVGATLIGLLMDVYSVDAVVAVLGVALGVISVTSLWSKYISARGSVAILKS